jgi:endonuclease YncB( thermonuclease family)
MKKLITLCVLSLAAVSALAADLVMPIAGVADGDTIRSTVKLPCPLCAVSVRIRGIDTPETGYLAKCSAEKTKGIAAKEFLTNFVINQPTMMARNIKWDKYGGRIDAVVEINGIDIGKLMLEKGFAKPYSGTGPKPDWCS